ncbi:MAG: CehA/McbA family metallohydrolase [Saprospiraceae bacterium]|nr:CehA/McbA family metallohydrolase [Saprospiraceae bacterium]
MQKYQGLSIIFCLCCLSQLSYSQHTHTHSVKGIEPQPLLAHSLRIADGLTFVGSPLPADISRELSSLSFQRHDDEMVGTIQNLLDPLCLAHIHINPESRVKVEPGEVQPVLVQGGWTTFLVKVHNEAGITPILQPESSNAEPLLHRSSGQHKMKDENRITPGEIDSRFLDLMIYGGRPLSDRLSGIPIEYFLLQVQPKVPGQREVDLSFNVGQGTQDIGFRNSIHILFNIRQSVKLVLGVKDYDGKPTMASFIINDGVDRFEDATNVDYRLTRAQSTHWLEGMKKEDRSLPSHLTGIYPLPARRLAAEDEYPDFFFQPQIYRADGEHVYLPPGKYHVTYERGPEYQPSYRQIEIPEGVEIAHEEFRLERWIHLTKEGWYSADHHIHASGCSHYESPEEGVNPEDMWRQVLGEDLNMGNNLTWGPSWYHQKQFFTGDNHELSDEDNILRYDVEVSGFPSSHAGHLVLLNLKEDDYPGTTVIEEWPSWTLPVLKWAKNQGGITGYAHSGWGLAPLDPTSDLPNFVTPKMDGIGANEYIVTVTHDVIDFYSAGDTPLPAELNIWYHTLNCGFKVPLSGETDFPCISDERVGRARIYAELDQGLDFDDYMDALLKGRSYVSTGHAHLIDFFANETKLGHEGSNLKLTKPQKVTVRTRAAAHLPMEQDEVGKIIASSNAYQSPYWHIERSRISQTRKVAVELLLNGEVVQKQEIEADGSWIDLTFDQPIERSGWIALRIYGSAHTNPIYINVTGKPQHRKKSAEWCLAAVDQCWKMKENQIRPEERPAAEQAYQYARKIYEQLIDSK